MSVRAKLSLSVALVSAAALLGLGGGWYWQDVQLLRAGELSTGMAGVMLDGILELEGDSLRKFAYDYSYWDDMVKFAATGDEEWAGQNLVPSLPVFGADAVWVFGPTEALSYSAHSEASPAYGEMVFEPSEFSASTRSREPRSTRPQIPCAPGPCAATSLSEGDGDRRSSAGSPSSPRAMRRS